MKRPTPLLWLIHADLFLLDRVAQPAVDFCSRRWGWHFVKIAETLCAMALAAWAAWAVQVALSINNAAGTATIMLGAVFGTTINGFFLHGAIRDARRTIHAGANINRYVLWPVRIMNGTFWGWLSIIPPLHWFYPAYCVLFVSGLYVLSCQAGPPKEQRVPSMAVTEVA